MSSRAVPRVRAVPLAYAYGLVALVGATVLAVSAYYLHHLAEAVKIPIQLAWTLPVALDAGAAFGTVCWIMADDESETQRFGRAFALACLAGTLAGNALAHLLDFRVIEVGPALAVGVGAVYPIVLFAIGHLVLLLRREQSATAVEVAEDASPMDQAPAGDASVIDRPVLVGVPVSDEAPGVLADTSVDGSEPASRRRRPSTVAGRRRWITAELDAGRTVTGGRVEGRFGSRNGAREVAQVKAEREAAASGAEVA